MLPSRRVRSLVKLLTGTPTLPQGLSKVRSRHVPLWVQRETNNFSLSRFFILFSHPLIDRPQSSHVSTAFNVFDDEDGDEFSLVDNRLSRTTVGARKTFTGKPQGKWTKPVPRVKGGTNWQNQGKKTKLQQRTANTAKPKYAKKRGGATTSRFTGGGPAYQKNRRRNELSLELESAWGEPVRTIDFSVLNKSTHSVPPSETLYVQPITHDFLRYL